MKFSSRENKKILDRTTDIIQKYYKESEINPVLKYKSPEELKKSFDLKIPKKGMKINSLFDELEKIVLNSPKTSSKGFFNLLFGGQILPAVAAEMLTAVLNNTMHTYKSAGIHILIENEVIDFMLKKIGFKNGDGIFTPGGSLSNTVAMIVARNEKDKNVINKGLYEKKMIAYTSDQGHYSLPKAINFVGIGKENLRVIKSDERGKMNLKELENQIKEDLKKGFIPFFIKATAGTTVLGAFDPILEISKIAKKYKIRLHVDASLGGTALLSKKYKHLLKGIDQADSVVWNPHKMMNVPVLAAPLLLKDPTLLLKSFYEEADYLIQPQKNEKKYLLELAKYNPAGKSIQCGRRNDAFKVWTALKYLGEDGYEKRVNQQFENAKYAVGIIKKDKDLKLMLEPECVNICFQVKGKSSKEICNKLDAEGKIKVSYGYWKGEEFIRLVCVNADMNKKDIQHFFECVKTI
ncbi:MAG: aminotransferase class V-fold PLP-dependent enzyme [Candidatus Absconditabacterales bacterium]